MNTQKNNTTLSDVNEYQKDFVKFFRVLYQKKWLIILGTTSFTVLAIILSFIMPKVYKCEAFYQLSGRQIPIVEKTEDEESENISEIDIRRAIMQALRETENTISVPEYKRYSSLFSSGGRFINYLEDKKILKEEEFKDVKNKILTLNNLPKWIEPHYSYSKEDKDQLAVIPEEEKNFVLGVTLSYENNHPDISKKIVYAIGDFIRDCIIYGKLRDYINSRYSFSAKEEKKYENLIINANFDLEQLDEKRQEIQSIYLRYPDSSKIENRQVISVEQKGYRFLSPLAQLVGIESKITDTKEELAYYKREMEKAKINNEFFSKMKGPLKENDSGEAIFREFIAKKDIILKDDNLNMETRKEVYNMLTIDLENFNQLFFEEMQFTSPPSVPKKNIRPKKSVVIIAGFFIGLFLFVFLTVALEFWAINKESIAEKK